MCLGYEFRLSWPENGHNRRSLVAVPNQGTEHADDVSNRFINTLFWHIATNGYDKEAISRSSTDLAFQISSWYMQDMNTHVVIFRAL
jgi:hypothetical protein